MPNEIRSASESSCTPKSLVVPVMRAMRPSSMSSTMATPMNGAAVASSPRIAWTTQAQPQNRLASVNRLGSSDTPRRMPRRSCRAWHGVQSNGCCRVCFLCAMRSTRYCASVASVVSPPTTLSPGLDQDRRRARQEQVDARSELHHAEALARAPPVRPALTPADDAPRQDADDLPARRRAAVVDRTRLRSIRSARRPPSCRPAGTCPDDTPPASRVPPTGVRLTWTSIGDRNMLMTCHSPAGAPGQTVSPATITRPSAGDNTRLAPVGGCAVGIAEEEEEKRGEDQKRHRPGAAEPEPHGDGDQQGAEDKRPPRAIDTHLIDDTGLRTWGLGLEGLTGSMEGNRASQARDALQKVLRGQAGRRD